jgi:hypothetical protein
MGTIRAAALMSSAAASILSTKAREIQNPPLNVDEEITVAIAYQFTKKLTPLGVTPASIFL